MVKSDNATRWNSTYYSLHRALKLQDRITLFCSKYEEDLADDTLSKAEWEELRTIECLLEPFYLITKRLEGNAVDGHYGSIWEALPAVEYLLQNLENAKTKYRRHKHLSVCINLAWDKLHAYYVLMDDTPAYALGVFLHPQHRWDYFERRWDTPDLRKYLRPTQDKIRRLWEEEYKSKLSAESLDIDDIVSESDKDVLNEFLNEGVDTKKDDFETYFAGDSVKLHKDQSLFLWWANSGLLQLAPMAYDILSVPAMSSEVERVFSGTKLTISPNRNRLSEDIIEATECLNRWFKAGL